MSHDTIRKTAVGCDCGCEVVLVTEFEQWGDEPEQIYVQFFTTLHGNKLRNRLRAAWRIARGKDPWLHDVVLQDDGLRDMRRAFAEPPSRGPSE